MRTFRDRKGQFIIIAALFLSIMILSVGTVIYSTVTYYRAERWEEYLTIVDSIKAGSSKVMEVSLASYTHTNNSTALRDNLNQWIRDVRKAYPGFGVDLNYTLASGVRSAYGESLNYNLGLARRWNERVSYSAANVTFTLNLASVGLTGYSFSAHAFLRTNMRGAEWYSRSGKQYVLVYLSVDKEGSVPVINLQTSNFIYAKLDGASSPSFSFKRYYSTTYSSYVYELRISSVTSRPSSVEVALKDIRGIEIVSTLTPIQENTS